ncbi:hypothetical protein Sango_2743400 [Sesamum angolense]|uniref:DUF4283 domain-containing protein n=1 Tax=Sesamum angolense TaxID=2727404 RepID=A0AAE1T953_9LAMI|nr:hypothetical protein Sango_2743400 [Sesamum angolense]
MVDEGEDGELEDGGHGAVSAAPTTFPTTEGDSTMVDEREDGELEDGGHGTVSAAPAMVPTTEGDSTMEKPKAEFNIKEFFELASRVIDDGDTESMEVLKNLKKKWMEKLGGEFASAGHGGLRHVQSRQLTPFPAPTSRPAHRFPQWPTAEQAALILNSAAPPSCSAEPQKMMTPWAPHRLLAAASTVAPSKVEKSLRSLASLSTPTPLTATTMDTEDGLLSPWLNQDPLTTPSSPRAAPPFANVWASSPSVFGSAESERSTAIAHFSLPPWARVAPPQQHAAPIPLPAPPVRPQPPTAAFATTSAPAKPLPELFIGNVHVHPHSAFKIEDDKIAAAFHKSSRKALNFIPPSVQNGEVIVHPSIDIIRARSQRWNTTGVGYFLGKKPYFHHLNEFVRSIWPAVRDVKATLNGFFFFQFETIAAMEEVIEGEGLSTVASGIGRPLYPDAITRACTRLDFARVCIMLNVSSKLPKHAVARAPFVARVSTASTASPSELAIHQCMSASSNVAPPPTMRLELPTASLEMGSSFAARVLTPTASAIYQCMSAFCSAAVMDGSSSSPQRPVFAATAAAIGGDGLSGLATSPVKAADPASIIFVVIQNGEVVVRSSIDLIRNGSTRWKTTAVGYFLGKGPYFQHLNTYVRSIWPAIPEVTATVTGFYFFQLKTEAAMEEVIEGGPWLFQCQPIVLEKWEPGMALRKLKHTQVPVWIKLRYLPVELWTTDGLSTVASEIGKPLYLDAITRACTRLDFARVCVMLDISSKLPRHVIIMIPLENGGESACKVDVEYEWLPSKCTSCHSLGHVTSACVLHKPPKPAIAVYVQKSKHVAPSALISIVEPTPEPLEDATIMESDVVMKDKGKQIVLFNTFDLLQSTNDDAECSSRGPNESSPLGVDPC